MQLDTFVMSALMGFVFLSLLVYVFYMFLVPWINEEPKYDDSWPKIHYSDYDYDDKSLN